MSEPGGATKLRTPSAGAMRGPRVLRVLRERKGCHGWARGPWENNFAYRILGRKGKF